MFFYTILFMITAAQPIMLWETISGFDRDLSAIINTTKDFYIYPDALRYMCDVVAKMPYAIMWSQPDSLFCNHTNSVLPVKMLVGVLDTHGNLLDNMATSCTTLGQCLYFGCKMARKNLSAYVLTGTCG